MKQLKRILLERYEGLSESREAQNIEEANIILERWAVNAPKSGYDKCSVRLEFDTGFIWSERYDLVHISKNKPNIQEWINTYLEFWLNPTPQHQALFDSNPDWIEEAKTLNQFQTQGEQMFTTIAQNLEAKQSINLIITKGKDDQLTVVIMPNEDKPEIRSLSLTGTPEELDVHINNIFSGFQTSRLTILEALTAAQEASKASAEAIKGKPTTKPAKPVAGKPIIEPTKPAAPVEPLFIEPPVVAAAPPTPDPMIERRKELEAELTIISKKVQTL